MSASPAAGIPRPMREPYAPGYTNAVKSRSAASLATEKRSFTGAAQALPLVSRRAENVLRRAKRLHALPERMDILEIGSAQGLFLITCALLGHRAIGVEPFAQAREIGEQLAREHGVQTQLLDGYAERLPVPSESMDFLYAASVIEHVDDAADAFAEAHRVLRPGGMFWFGTASSMCPRQSEIRGFPGFGWYPNALKLRIMAWALEHRPALIGHTGRPAIHWFTPWKARRMLANAGFSKVYDRWDIRLPEEGGKVYRIALRVIKSSFLTKCAADTLVPGCSYIAIK